jgi:hypothetical protein
MKAMKRGAACLALLALSGCGPRVVEDPLDFSDPQTIEESCRTWCEIDNLCCTPSLEDGFECSTWQVDEATCIAECISTQSEWDFSAECRDDYYSNIACASELSCEEYVEYWKEEPGHRCEEEKQGRREMLDKGCFGT